ncbi:MAG: hypothetical protein U9Q07_05875, partial [Planctomycetota bacterium]|nr:hypothetical protein [Planctomycetota bacterium]
ATVELRAVIQDITVVDPDADPDAGNISYGSVTFVDRDTHAVIAADVPVALLDGDPTTGVALYEWSVDLGNADSASFTVGCIVNGFYTRNDSYDNTVVTVSKPVPNSITGGGSLINFSCGGLFGGDPGLRTNFGFNVKFNKKLTNIQGHVNIIVRQDGRVYQIKTNATDSLVVNRKTGEATFISKANLMDITDPDNPISVSGNLSLIITLTDSGAPAIADSIGITLWNRDKLWFSSYWTGVKTEEELLAGGNLVIH